jgi:hypothetical protein
MQAYSDFVYVDNNHHVAGKDMCGVFVSGFLRRNKKQAIGVLVYMQAYIRTVQERPLSVGEYFEASNTKCCVDEARDKQQDQCADYSFTSKADNQHQKALSAPDK